MRNTGAGVRILLPILAAAAVACGGSGTPDGSHRDTHEYLNATLWRQASAEYEAVAVQTYAAARRQLGLALADPSWTASLEQERMAAEGAGHDGLPPAVILDLDETVLENAPYAARLIRAGSPHEQEVWDTWCDEGAADAVPGALEFIRDAEARGVTVFYVTNRRTRCEDATRRNLANLGIDPGPEDDDRVLTRGENGWTGDKTARRQVVAERYRVLLLVGDNLGDFAAIGGLSVPERSALVEKHAHRWGTTWIMIPNPIYGSWQSALLGYEKLPDDEALRRYRDELDTKQER